MDQEMASFMGVNHLFISLFNPRFYLVDFFLLFFFYAHLVIIV
jgi:hypothetical protein